MFSAELAFIARSARRRVRSTRTVRRIVACTGILIAAAVTPVGNGTNGGEAVGASGAVTTARVEFASLEPSAWGDVPEGPVVVLAGPTYDFRQATAVRMLAGGRIRVSGVTVGDVTYVTLRREIILGPAAVDDGQGSAALLRNR
jgi:hypothetical protein